MTSTSSLYRLATIRGATIVSALFTLTVAFQLEASAQGNKLFGVQMFPANSVFNTSIATTAVHPNSATWINSIGAHTALHADFGTVFGGLQNGIPYNQSTASTPQANITFQFADESNSGPYSFSRSMNIEGSAAPGRPGSGDSHLLSVNTSSAASPILEECWLFAWGSGQNATAGSGAKWTLTSNAMRPAGWTSADAAGLPITPLLLKYNETFSAANGGPPIQHALRFTVARTQKKYLWPASHFASSNTSASLPPMGIRVRLKSSFKLTKFSAMNQAIGRAMQTYGMILADNGSNWYVSGEPNPKWNDSDLHTFFSAIKGSDLEVVNENPMHKTPNSYQAN